jgi:rare lipoprotein A
MIRIITAAALLCALGFPALAQTNPFSGAISISLNLHRVETCMASQYGVGDGYNGKRAADGSIFDTYATNPYTVAMLKPRKLGSWVTVTNLTNGKSIRAKITDRGPYYHARCVDLGRAGANALGMGGTARVSVE